MKKLLLFGLLSCLVACDNQSTETKKFSIKIAKFFARTVEFPLSNIQAEPWEEFCFYQVTESSSPDDAYWQYSNYMQKNSSPSIPLPEKKYDFIFSFRNKKDIQAYGFFDSKFTVEDIQYAFDLGNASTECFSGSVKLKRNDDNKIIFIE